MYLTTRRLEKKKLVDKKTRLGIRNKLNDILRLYLCLELIILSLQYLRGTSNCVVRLSVSFIEIIAVTMNITLNIRVQKTSHESMSTED